MSAMTSELLAQKTAFDPREAAALIAKIKACIQNLSPGSPPAGFDNGPFKALAGPVIEMHVRNPNVTVEDMFYDYD